MIIYYFNDFDAVGEEQLAQMLACMPQQQLDALAGTKLLSRKREIAISYLTLSYALENNANEIQNKDVIIRKIDSHFIISASQLPYLSFRIAEHGKPYLIGHDGIHFNISHCKQAIVTAVSDHEIGIDVEGWRRCSDQLLQRAFNENEQAMVHNASEKDMEFARIWTRKEAYFKWTGTGILIDHIKSVESDAADHGCRITTQLITPQEGAPFFLSIAQ